MTDKKIAIVKNENIGRIAYEMGLHKWLIISKHAEEKNTRTNIKKLGCLFEAFIGALFLDFNKKKINDEENWFKNVFVTGPGFQIAQIFIENIFEKHIDWTELISNDDNYKNILQVKIQKEFKVTPHYLELETTEEEGYHMGVFLCIGQHHHGLTYKDAMQIKDLTIISKKVTENIEHYLNNVEDKIWLFLGDSKHKIKKKAEQDACKNG